MVSATDQSARLRLRTHGLRPGRIQSAGDDRSVFGWAFRPRHRSASTTASDFKADLASSKLRYGPNSRVTFPLQKQAAIGVFRDARLCRYLRDRYPMLDVSTTLQGCGPARLPCGFQPAHRVIGDCERPRSGPGSCSGPTRDHDAVSGHSVTEIPDWPVSPSPEPATPRWTSRRRGPRSAPRSRPDGFAARPAPPVGPTTAMLAR